MKRSSFLASLLLVAGLSTAAHASQINFDGGTAYLGGGGTVTTTNTSSISNVDYYVENGFKVDFIGSNEYIGNYYGVGNAVIHGHWDTGPGNLQQIKITKTDNSAFDLNYFLLTSNTAVGGGAANGTERVFIHASLDGVTSSFSQLLPVENWGFPATQMILGSQFDNIKAFWFTAENFVYCFGMDSFYIDEMPAGVPEPATLALFGLALAGMSLRRRVK